MLDVQAEYQSLDRVQSARTDYWLHSSVCITVPLVPDNIKVVYDDAFQRCIMNCRKDRPSSDLINHLMGENDLLFAGLYRTPP